MFEFRLTAFTDALAPAFESRGYEWVASGQQFRKQHAYGFNAVVFSPAVYDDEVILEVSLGSRHRLVEELMTSIGKQGLSNGRYGFSAITTLGKQLELKHQRLRAGSPEQTRELGDALLEFFESGGFELLEKLARRDGLHQALNYQPGKPSMFANNQLLRCFRGLAIAHIIDAPNLHSLAEVYENRLQKLGAPVEMHRSFVRMFEYFRAFGLN
jgi:hypothetical protein